MTDSKFIPMTTFEQPQLQKNQMFGEMSQLLINNYESNPIDKTNPFSGQQARPSIYSGNKILSVDTVY